MTRLDLQTFVARHQAQATTTTALRASPALAPVAAADVDNDGVIAGAPELTEAYRKLLALEPGASALDDAGNGPAASAYRAFTLTLRQATGVEARLRGALSSVPELVSAFSGAPGTALHRVDGVRQRGVGSVQDALNQIAARDELASGTPSTFRVPLGVNDANRGLFGPGTERAVQAFQQTRGLPATGVVDGNTLKALDAALLQGASTTNARFADAAFDRVSRGLETIGVRSTSRAAVQALQQALLDMGFPLGPHPDAGVASSQIDGAFGERTRVALRNFQVHASKRFPGVQPTGVLDKKTLEALQQLAPAPGKTSWDPGQPRQAPTPRWAGDASKPLRAVVVLDEHRTFLFDAQGQLQRIVSNAVGAQGTATSTGLKKVDVLIDQAGAQAMGQQLWNNPAVFGTRVVGLRWADGRTSGEELHGTNAPDSIGKDASHGCMRHYNEDIERMYTTLRAGHLVAVVGAVNATELA